MNGGRERTIAESVLCSMLPTTRSRELFQLWPPQSVIEAIAKLISSQRGRDRAYRTVLQRAT